MPAMAASSIPEKDVETGLEEHAAFLSGSPRSGELSPFAQKLAAQAFVWLCSIVVFGSTINHAAGVDHCSPLCRFDIAAGIISFIFASGMLVGQYLTWSNHIDKSSWLSTAAEKRVFILLSIWWGIGVATLSALELHPSKPKEMPVNPTSGVAILFGWLAFFGSIYGSYKAYHSGKEEQRSLHYAQVMSLQATEEEEYANFS